MFILGDLLNKLNLAIKLKVKYIYVFNTKVSLKVLEILHDLGYIEGFIILSFKYIKVNLKYHDNINVIRGIHLVSKPSSKIYFSSSQFKRNRVNNFFEINGFLVSSTSKGLLTDIECIMLKVGGEPLFMIL